VNLVVIAKSPTPGRVKTRLSPPCTPTEAAAIAEAALADTLRAVAATRGIATRVIALEGGPGSWLADGFEVIPQRGGGLDERLASALHDTGGPALLIGMDTPQLKPPLLRLAVDRLRAPGVDGVLGLAHDGGWWGIGLREPDDRVFLGVPMSTDRTGPAQRERMRRLGLSVEELPPLRDVDSFEDALAVSPAVPGSRFAGAVRSARAAHRELAPVPISGRAAAAMGTP
jgi:uncharacterized protein